MPGHAGSPYWAAVDFDSEGEDVPTPPPSHRVYLDPWDTSNDAHGVMPQETPESSQDENFNSFAGEPVSASFYYVPTKNYDSGDEPPLPPPRRKISVREDLNPDDYAIYGRKMSRATVPEVHAVYGERPRDRRRSVYIEEPVYAPHPMPPMMYEPMYGGMAPPAPGCPGFLPVPPRPRTRVSLPHQPDYIMAAHAYGKARRHSRLPDAYNAEFVYESLSPEYEDWARPFPKTAPDNFHLSKYGHLQIDYSFSWHSLDRLIRNQ